MGGLIDRAHDVMMWKSIDGMESYCRHRLHRRGFTNVDFDDVELIDVDFAEMEFVDMEFLV